MKSLTTKQFIEKAKKIHGNTYDYSLSEYVKSIKPVIIICNIHGQFYQKPNDHISDKNGCPKCKFEKIGNLKRKNISVFIDQIKNIHGDRYDYSKINYKNCKEKIQLTCNIHGIFFIIPSKLLVGRGCPLCSKSLSNGEIKIIEILNDLDCEFVRNKTFPNLKGHFNLLRLDFYIPKYNLVIEYDGEFHFNSEKQFDKLHLTKEEIDDKFLKVREYDSIKNIYCCKNKINLLRISYKTYSKSKIKKHIIETIDEINIDVGDKGFITKFVE